jgi:hypothetical protein
MGAYLTYSELSDCWKIQFGKENPILTKKKVLFFVEEIVFFTFLYILFFFIFFLFFLKDINFFYVFMTMISLWSSQYQDKSKL